MNELELAYGHSAIHLDSLKQEEAIDLLRGSSRMKLEEANEETAVTLVQVRVPLQCEYTFGELSYYLLGPGRATSSCPRHRPSRCCDVQNAMDP